MAWCFEDEEDAYAERVFDHLADAPAVVPAHFPLEVANAMLVALRRGRIDRAHAEAFLAKIAELPLEPVARAPEIRISFDLGYQYNLSSYDAAYLNLAMVEAIPLATNDLDLRRAARKTHVAILNP